MKQHVHRYEVQGKVEKIVESRWPHAVVLTWGRCRCGLYAKLGDGRPLAVGFRGRGPTLYGRWLAFKLVVAYVLGWLDELAEEVEPIH